MVELYEELVLTVDINNSCLITKDEGIMFIP